MRKTKWKPKLLSFFLSIALVVTLTPNVAFMGGGGDVYAESGDPVAGSVCQIGSTEYETLAEALEAVEANGTVTEITVLEDQNIVMGAEMTTALDIKAGQNIVIDLNGKTITGAASGTGSTQLIMNKGTLRIKDSSSEGTGTIKHGANSAWIEDGTGTYAGSYASNLITNMGTLIVDGGSLENVSTGSAAYVIDNNSNGVDVNAVINSGRFIAAGNTAVRMFCNSDSKENNLTINGGYFEATYYGVQMRESGGTARQGALVINDGVFEARSDEWNLVVRSTGSAANTTAVINGGYFNDPIGFESGVDARINAGYFKVKEVSFEDDGETYNYKLSDYLDENHLAVNNVDYNDQGKESAEYKFTVMDEEAVVETFAVKITDANGAVTYKKTFPTTITKSGTYALLKDVSVSRLVVGNVTAKNLDVTLDLNGHELTTTSASTTLPAFMIHTSSAGNEVTVKNGTFNITGGLFGFAPKGKSGNTLNLASDLTVNTAVGGVLVEGNAVLNCEAAINSTGNKAAIQTNGSTSADSVINITGGRIISAGIGIYLPAGTLNISDGTITGDTAVYAKSGTVSITGGTLEGTGKAEEYTYSGNGAVATGEALIIDNCGYPSGTPVVTVTGGTFTSSNAQAVGSYGYGEGNEAVSEFINGGTFSSDVTELCAEGFISVAEANADGSYGVKAGSYAAQIGETKYETLAEALEAVEANGTVTLLKDVETGGITVASGKNFVLDFNGKTVTFNKPGAGSTGTKTIGFQLLKDSTIEFKNGTITIDESNKDLTWTKTDTEKGIAMLIQNYANLTLTNMNIDGTNIAHNGADFRYVMSNNSGAVAISGTTGITAASGDYAFDACKYDNYTAPTVTVNTTGTITGNIEASGGQLKVEAGTFNGEISVGDGYTAGDIAISGGTFSSDVTEFCAEGFAAYKTETGAYGVQTEDPIMNDIKNLQNDLSDLEARVAASESAIEALDDTYATDADINDVKADLETANETIEALQTIVENLQNDSATSADLEEATARIEALEAAIDGIEGTVKAYVDDAIADLQSKIDANKVLIDGLNGTYATDAEVADAIEAAKTAIADAQAAIDAAQDAAAEANAQAITKAVTDLTEAYDAADNAVLEAAKAYTDDAIADLQSKIDANKVLIDGLNGTYATDAEVAEAIEAAKTAIAAAQAAIDEAQDVAAEANAQAIAQAVTDLTEAYDAADNAVLEAAKAYTDEVKGTLQAQIDANKTKLEQLDGEYAKDAEVATAIETAKAAIEEAQKAVDAAQDVEIAGNATRIAALELAVAGTDNATYAAAIAYTDKKIAELQAQINALRTEMAQNNLDNVSVNLTAKAADYQNVNLSWNTSKAKVSGNYVTYKIYSKKSTETEWNVIYETACPGDGKAMKYTVTGLDTGTKYEFYSQVSAVVDGIELTGQESKTVSAKPVPAKAKISSLVAGKSKLTVKFPKVAGATGYQVFYRDWSVVSGKTVLVTGSKATYTKTISKLKKNHKYSVKVRVYRTVNGQKVYGAWSAAKSVKVK